MQSELRRKISYRTRAQNSGVPSPPSAILLQILALAAVGVVDSAVQHEFSGAAFDLRERYFGEQRDRIVIQLPPAVRIEIEKQTSGVIVPAPPQIASERP